MPAGDLDLEFLDAWILELNNLATADTNQVIVVLVMITRFVACLAIAKMPLLGNTAFSKKL